MKFKETLDKSLEKEEVENKLINASHNIWRLGLLECFINPWRGKEVRKPHRKKWYMKPKSRINHIR